MSSRSLFVLAPILALLTGGFALYQLWVAGIAMRVQNWAFAGFYLVFGVAGLAVTQALWRMRRGLGRPKG